MEWAVITLLVLLGSLLIVLIVAMFKYFQMSRIHKSVQNAWHNDGVCTGMRDSTMCKLSYEVDLPPIPTRTSDFNPTLAYILVDAVARVELETAPPPPGYEIVDQYKPDHGPPFGVVYKQGQKMIMAFRATVTNSEIQYDLNAWQVVWSTGEEVLQAIPESTEQVNIDGSEPYVHAGFYTVLSKYMRQITDTLLTHKPTELYIAGHSLGGAVGTLAVQFIAEQMPTKFPFLEGLQAYVFGTPRCGNKAFHNLVVSNQRIEALWRVSNEADGIQDLPIKVMPNTKHPDNNVFYYSHAGETRSYDYQWGSWETNHFLPNYKHYINSLGV